MSLCVCVCVCVSVCVCVCVCARAHLYGLNVEHKFRIWVTILGHTLLYIFFYFIFMIQSNVDLLEVVFLNSEVLL